MTETLTIVLSSDTEDEIICLSSSTSESDDDCQLLPRRNWHSSRKTTSFGVGQISRPRRTTLAVDVPVIHVKEADEDEDDCVLCEQIKVDPTEVARPGSVQRQPVRLDPPKILRKLSLPATATRREDSKPLLLRSKRNNATTTTSRTIPTPRSSPITSSTPAAAIVAPSVAVVKRSAPSMKSPSQPVGHSWTVLSQNSLNALTRLKSTETLDFDQTLTSSSQPAARPLPTLKIPSTPSKALLMMSLYNSEKRSRMEPGSRKTSSDGSPRDVKKSPASIERVKAKIAMPQQKHQQRTLKPIQESAVKVKSAKLKVNSPIKKSSSVECIEIQPSTPTLHQQQQRVLKAMQDFGVETKSPPIKTKNSDVRVKRLEFEDESPEFKIKSAEVKVMDSEVRSPPNFNSIIKSPKTKRIRQLVPLSVSSSSLQNFFEESSRLIQKYLSGSKMKHSPTVDDHRGQKDVANPPAASSAKLEEESEGLLNADLPQKATRSSFPTSLSDQCIVALPSLDVDQNVEIKDRPTCDQDLAEFDFTPKKDIFVQFDHHQWASARSGYLEDEKDQKEAQQRLQEIGGSNSLLLSPSRLVVTGTTDPTGSPSLLAPETTARPSITPIVSPSLPWRALFGVQNDHQYISNRSWADTLKYGKTAEECDAQPQPSHFEASSSQDTLGVASNKAEYTMSTTMVDFDQPAQSRPICLEDTSSHDTFVEANNAGSAEVVDDDDDVRSTTPTVVAELELPELDLTPLKYRHRQSRFFAGVSADVVGTMIRRRVLDSLRQQTASTDLWDHPDMAEFSHSQNVLVESYLNARECCRKADAFWCVTNYVEMGFIPSRKLLKRLVAVLKDSDDSVIVALHAWSALSQLQMTISWDKDDGHTLLWKWWTKCSNFMLNNATAVNIDDGDPPEVTTSLKITGHGLLARFVVEVLENDLLKRTKNATLDFPHSTSLAETLLSADVDTSNVISILDWITDAFPKLTTDKARVEAHIYLCQRMLNMSLAVTKDPEILIGFFTERYCSIFMGLTSASLRLRLVNFDKPPAVQIKFLTCLLERRFEIPRSLHSGDFMLDFSASKLFKYYFNARPRLVDLSSKEFEDSVLESPVENQSEHAEGEVELIHILINLLTDYSSVLTRLFRLASTSGERKQLEQQLNQISQAGEAIDRLRANVFVRCPLLANNEEFEDLFSALAMYGEI